MLMSPAALAIIMTTYQIIMTTYQGVRNGRRAWPCGVRSAA